MHLVSWIIFSIFLFGLRIKIKILQVLMSYDFWTDSGVVTRAGGMRSGRRSKDSLNFLGGNKKAKVITLQIKGLTDQVS